MSTRNDKNDNTIVRSISLVLGLLALGTVLGVRYFDVGPALKGLFGAKSEAPPLSADSWVAMSEDDRVALSALDEGRAVMKEVGAIDTQIQFHGQERAASQLCHPLEAKKRAGTFARARAAGNERTRRACDHVEAKIATLCVADAAVK